MTRAFQFISANSYKVNDVIQVDRSNVEMFDFGIFRVPSLNIRFFTNTFS